MTGITAGEAAGGEAAGGEAATAGEAAGGEGRTDGDAVVGARLQLELEAEDEVGVLALGKQIAAAAFGAIEDAILHPVAIALAAEKFPAVKRLAIEDRQEASLAVQCDAACEDRCAEGDRPEAGKKFAR